MRLWKRSRLVATALVGALVTSCGGASGVDGGSGGLETCATTGGPAIPAAGQHFELVPSGVRPGSALRPMNGELRLVEGGPVISYSDSFTRATPDLRWIPSTLGSVTPDNTVDDLAVLVDPRVVSDFETRFAFNMNATGQVIADYRTAIRVDPTTQLGVRVGVSGADYLVSGQSAPTLLRPWTMGDTLIGGVTRFRIADIAVTFDFEGDAACHVRNLKKLVKAEGQLAFSQFFATQSAEQLKELQRYLALAKPHTRLFSLRSNGPAFTNLPQCELTNLESCLHLTDALAAVETQWLANCPAPTDASLKGAPETCQVEGKLTLRPYP